MAAFLNVRDRKVLVVGGGPVGRRRSLALVNAGANVRLVCLEESPSSFDDRVHWLTEPYSSHHLKDISLAVAAAPHAVNLEVLRDCRDRGIWVNVASEPELGDWIVPATAGREGIQIAVSTGGAWPGLASSLCQRLSLQMDEDLIWLVRTIGGIRKTLRAECSKETSRAIMRRLGAIDWLDLLEESGIEAVRERLREVVGPVDDR